MKTKTITITSDEMSLIAAHLAIAFDFYEPETCKVGKDLLLKMVDNKKELEALLEEHGISLEKFDSL